eukprot:s3226_g2.t1
MRRRVDASIFQSDILTLLHVEAKSSNRPIGIVAVIAWRAKAKRCEKQRLACRLACLLVCWLADLLILLILRACWLACWLAGWRLKDSMNGVQQVRISFASRLDLVWISFGPGPHEKHRSEQGLHAKALVLTALQCGAVFCCVGRLWAQKREWCANTTGDITGFKPQVLVPPSETQAE